MNTHTILEFLKNVEQLRSIKKHCFPAVRICRPSNKIYEWNKKANDQSKCLRNEKKKLSKQI